MSFLSKLRQYKRKPNSSMREIEQYLAEDLAKNLDDIRQMGDRVVELQGQRAYGITDFLGTNGAYLLTGTSSSDYYQPENAEVQLVTSGRPVFLGIFFGRMDYPADEGFEISNGGTFSAGSVKWHRDDTEISLAKFTIFTTGSGATTTSVTMPLGPWTIDMPPAGNYRYKMTVAATMGHTIEFDGARMIAFEI